MTAKTIKNSGSGSVQSSIAYAQRENVKDLSDELKPQVVLLNNLTYSDSKSVAKEMKLVNCLNKNIADNKKHIHETVNFSAKDIQKLDTPEKRAEATEKYLENKGITKENFQYIAIEHRDTDNIHHHVVHNRVGIDGEVYKASANFERSAAAQERTEKEFNLDNGIERKVIYAPEEERGYKANPNYQKDVGIVKTPKNIRINDKREKDRVLTDKQKRIIIQKEITNALSKSEISDINKLKFSLSEKGISVQDRYDKEQKLTGIKFIYKEHPATGTQVGYKSNLISSKLEENLQKEIAERKNIDRENIKPLPKVEIESREERFKKADIQINQQIENRYKTGEKINFGHDIDPILKEEISKEFPKENVWAVIDEQGGHGYQDKLSAKIEKLEKEQTNKIDQKKEGEKIEPSVNKVQEKQEEELKATEINRFDQSKSKREEKQEQNQDQEKKRGFRR